MIEIIERLVESKFVIGVALAVFSGLSIRVVLTLVKQRWVSTYHHTMSYTLLPLITLIITTVISGNIALSLGMIGALSIVRFRNPVKSPFELVLFFALITIGISMAVNYKYGLVLTIVINTVIIIAYWIEVLGNKIGFQTFVLSFDEGNANQIIEIQANGNIIYLDNHPLLLQYVANKAANEVYYRLASRSRKELEKIRFIAEKDDSVLSIELRLS